MPKQGKPIRLVSQSASDITCTYAALVNLFQSKKGLASFSDFKDQKRKERTKFWLTEDRKAQTKRRIAKQEGISKESVTSKQVKEYLKPQLMDYIKQTVDGPGGPSPSLCDDSVKQKYALPNSRTNTADYTEAKNALIQIYAKVGKLVFYHMVCIRNGYVIESIDLPGIEDGVYKWTGKFKGYKTQPSVQLSYVYPDNLFEK